MSPLSPSEGITLEPKPLWPPRSAKISDVATSSTSSRHIPPIIRTFLFFFFSFGVTAFTVGTLCSGEYQSSLLYQLFAIKMTSFYT